MKLFTLRKAAALAFASLAVVLESASATPIHVEMTTTNGVVPGTGISYTLTDNGNGGARNIFPAASSDNGTWSWNNGLPEYLSFGSAQTLIVTFNAPISIDHMVLGINSTSSSTSQLALSGGTATTADFNLTDGLQVYTGATGLAAYTAATGVITASGQNQSLMLGSSSTNTISGFTLTAGASDGGADGYTVFVGFTQATVPEPATIALFGVGLGLLRFQRRSRTR